MSIFTKRICPKCSQENNHWHKYCATCGALLKPTVESEREPEAEQIDKGFDSAGFAVGMMTGVPLSPTSGISTGALIGAALHNANIDEDLQKRPDDDVKGGGGSMGGAGASAAYASTPENNPWVAPDEPTPSAAPDPSPSSDSSSSSSDSGSSSSSDSGGGGSGGD